MIVCVGICLARLANLPDFFTMSKAISVSTDRFSRYFHQIEGICVNFLDQVQFFPIPQGTLPWQPILWQNCGKITYPSCIYRSVIPKRNGISP